MTLSDKLTAAGLIVTGFGSTLGMIGIYKQTNGYFAFQSRDFFYQVTRIVRKYFAQGPEKTKYQMDIDAALGKARGEDRGKALIGFYLVLMGFLLQMTGSAIMFGALFFNKDSPEPQLPSSTTSRPAQSHE